MHAFVASAAGRVKSLAEETDRVIAGIQADAGAHVSDGREDPKSEGGGELLREFAETLSEYAVGIRQQCEELYEVLERASAQLQANEAPGGDPPKGPVAETERAPDPSSGRASPEGGEDETDQASEGLRLLATQMAAAGSNRVEIEHQLRAQFGVANARQLVDEIFSP